MPADDREELGKNGHLEAIENYDYLNLAQKYSELILE
jgi:hypothetical protein